jgi:hypothetical protein
MVWVAAMSEFKFACPVCGQHITADSSTSGGQITCPTCFQKIVVPQAPSLADSKLIVAASQVGKPRPLPTEVASQTGPLPDLTPRTSMLAAVALLLLLSAVGAGLWVFRDKLFKRNPPETKDADRKSSPPPAPMKIYPIPTNFSWTTNLADADFPDTRAAGSIHGKGFFCERATLQGGNLTLRQGRNGPPDLGVSIGFFAHQGEELSGKNVQILPDPQPRQPLVTLRWKEETQKAVNEKISGGYALKVAFGDAANGRISGRIYLCLPDDAKSFVAGTFDAEIRKPSPPKHPKAPNPPTNGQPARPGA